MPTPDPAYERAWQVAVERHGTPTCPFCASQQWTVYGSLMLPVGEIGGKAPESSAPVVSVLCVECGYIMQFDAFHFLDQADQS